MIKALAAMDYLDRELYFLQVDLYYIEKEITKAGYALPIKSETFIRAGIDADRIIRVLYLLYGKDILLDYSRLTCEQKYMASECCSSADLYARRYADCNGRLPLGDFRA